MKTIILAGGSGTRLWPLSRTQFPKQFLRFGDDASLLQKTVRRQLLCSSAAEVYVISNAQYDCLVQDQVESVAPVPSENILLEPCKRNTAPAIALMVKYLEAIGGASEEEVLFVCPSDHFIPDHAGFAVCLEKVAKAAKAGTVVTMGVQPTHPHTGYGYICANRQKKIGDAYEVRCFVEKPSKEKAEEYLEEGNFLWNAGMFAFSIGTFKKELRQYCPEIADLYDCSFAEMQARFEEMPEISFDYAVMEKSEQVAVVSLDIPWSDVGSYDSLYETLPFDKDKNVALGPVLMENTKNCLIMGGRHLIATIGLEDVVVVETPDAILVSKRGESQKVQNIVKRLKAEKRTEAHEHVTTVKPWGSYTILEEGPRYKIKRIAVHPGRKLSLQSHFHRSEHWTVVTGTAWVTIGEKEVAVHENESVYIPKSEKHRLENRGKIPLELIEVQVGEYLGEDDIIRYQDDYGRLSPSGDKPNPVVSESSETQAVQT